MSLADTPSADEVRARIGPLSDRPLLLWDDVRELTEDHMRLLDEIAAEGGRVLVIRDRPPDPAGLPVIPMPNFPGEEAQALALAVAADAGVTLTPEAAMTVGSHLHGHALAIELAAREIARRGGAMTKDGIESLLDELRTPPNGNPAAWARPLGEQLEIGGTPRDATLVAQFRGYVSVPGLGSLRDDGDFDAAQAALEAMAARGILKRVGPAVYAIHPGLRVALAAAGRYEPPSSAFAQAVAEAASAWAALAETGQGEPPWPAEASNIVSARRLASREGWWPLVVRLLDGVVALGLHGGMLDVARTEILAAAADFVDPDTGEPHPGMEEFGPVFLGHLAWVAEMQGDRAKVARLRIADVAHRRAAAAEALSVAPDRRTDGDRALVRRLAVGLTNRAQLELRDPAGLDAMTEAVGLARTLGDWRLEALNRLNLGVYWMTVPVPPDFERADAEFAAGYKLAIQDDPPLAGKLMTERGTVHYERARATADPDAARAEFERAAQLFELAVGLREPDAVLSHQLGQVHRYLGHHDDARTWFEQAIELRDAEHEPGASADARLHLALTLQGAGLVDEALSFARSAEQVLAQAAEPDATLQLQIEQALARLVLQARASETEQTPSP